MTLVWEKIASTLGHVEKWRLWKDACEALIFFFLPWQWVLKWETSLKEFKNKFLTRETLVANSWPKRHKTRGKIHPHCEDNKARETTVAAHI